jgi:exopolyphosphatase/guanosine-5'-triphosphate,3'-diphosphate pyrophosphatase
VVAIKERGWRRLHREKRMVRLGDGLFERGSLDPAAIERVEDALRDFMLLHRALGGRRMRAVATAAMREAPEAPQLAQRWRDHFDIDFKVISGEEEAALIARGVMVVEKVPSGGFGLIDIGGGSTEISLCQGPKVLESFSLPLGANRLQQAYLKRIPPIKEGIAALRADVEGTVSGMRAQHQWPGLKELIGSGGTIRAVRRLAKSAGAKDQPFTVHFLSDLVRQMERLDRVGLLHIPGMDEKRVDLILAGALLLEEAAKALGVQRIRATEASLRDGLLATERDALGLNGKR